MHALALQLELLLMTDAAVSQQQGTVLLLLVCKRTSTG